MKRKQSLAEACIAEAFAIVGEVGVGGLSIREVARRLGVSHQAPYKHFRSSEHLLAEIIRRTYVLFGEYLEKRAQTGEAAMDMNAIGQAYFRFAKKYPLHYRLIFATPLPNPEQYPETLEACRQSFGVLLNVMDRAGKDSKLDALFVWSAVHGLATILESGMLKELGYGAKAQQAAPGHVLNCIGKALQVKH